MKKLLALLNPLPPTSGGKVIDEFTSARGWAITLVLLFHLFGTIYGYGAIPDAPVYLSILLNGNTGVTLFFVISGYMLSFPFFSTNAPSIKQFYWNRIFRIMPLYGLIVIVWSLHLQNCWQGIRALLFYDLRINQLWPFGVVWWSLGVEVQYYALLPFVMYVFCRKRNYVLALLFFTVLVAGYWIALTTLQQNVYNTFFNLKDNIIGRWPCFLSGILLAWFNIGHGSSLRKLTSGAVCKKVFLGDILMVAIIGALIFIAVKITHTMGVMVAHVGWFQHYAIEAFLWACFLFVLTNFDLRCRRLFVNPIMDVLGVLSYSMYLLHPYLLNKNIIAPLLSNPNFFMSIDIRGYKYIALFFILTFVFSLMTYLLIERPFLILKSRLRGKLVDR